MRELENKIILILTKKIASCDVVPLTKNIMEEIKKRFYYVSAKACFPREFLTDCSYEERKIQEYIKHKLTVALAEEIFGTKPIYPTIKTGEHEVVIEKTVWFFKEKEAE